MLDLRSSEKEWIDFGSSHYSLPEYEDCLIKLDRIGRWLGGHRATFKSLNRLKQPPKSILDIGCGGGLFTRELAYRYPQAKVLGIDLNPLSIEFAKKQGGPSNLNFELTSHENLEMSDKSFDVVLSTLVCHHLSEAILIEFLKRCHRLAKTKVIINDLHRHPLAYSCFKVISPLLFRNRLIQHDGLLSIKRAFTQADWIEYLKRAEILFSDYSIKWHWAFRWLIEIHCEDQR